jgi:hypothetical protein
MFRHAVRDFSHANDATALELMGLWHSKPHLGHYPLIASAIKFLSSVNQELAAKLRGPLPILYILVAHYYKPGPWLANTESLHNATP